jgi:hypothetical protein
MNATIASSSFIYLGTNTGGPRPTARPSVQDFLIEWRG